MAQPTGAASRRRDSEAEAHQPGETFKREGPEPPTESTGRTVEEMNRIALRAVLRNIRPDDEE